VVFAADRLEDVEFVTLEWVAWYNGSRLLEPLGYVPRPRSRRPIMTVRLLQSAWRFSRNEFSGKPGAVQARQRATARLYPRR